MARNRLYGLFQKTNGNWVRLPGPDLTKEAAVRYYQTRLLCLSLSGMEPMLRPVGYESQAAIECRELDRIERSMG